jgi:two-component system cell cycle sensor histidine kinase/response regulator CckA
MADVTQLEQVLMNLTTNGRDAMPEGGTLIIEAKATTMDHQFLREHGFGKPGSYALMSVTDNGCGMDGPTKEKIFEPFFTTKEMGRGTGLGLSIVYGIVKQHDGYICVTSEPGHGTTFEIYLPIVKAKIEKDKSVAAPIRGGTETILMAEDNGEVRALAKSVLEEYGYRVIEAHDGTEAVKAFMEHKEEIDLVILDVVMPGKNGKQVDEELRKQVPLLNTIFISGYTADIVLGKGIHNTSFNFISKPVTPAELLQKVRGVLDRKT